MMIGFSCQRFHTLERELDISTHFLIIKWVYLMSNNSSRLSKLEK